MVNDHAPLKKSGSSLSTFISEQWENYRKHFKRNQNSGRGLSDNKVVCRKKSSESHIDPKLDLAEKATFIKPTIHASDRTFIIPEDSEEGSISNRSTKTLFICKANGYYDIYKNQQNNASENMVKTTQDTYYCECKPDLCSNPPPPCPNPSSGPCPNDPCPNPCPSPCPNPYPNPCPNPKIKVQLCKTRSGNDGNQCKCSYLDIDTIKCSRQSCHAHPCKKKKKSCSPCCSKTCDSDSSLRCSCQGQEKERKRLEKCARKRRKLDRKAAKRCEKERKKRLKKAMKNCSCLPPCLSDLKKPIGKVMPCASTGPGGCTMKCQNRCACHPCDTTTAPTASSCRCGGGVPEPPSCNEAKIHVQSSNTALCPKQDDSTANINCKDTLESVRMMIKMESRQNYRNINNILNELKKQRKDIEDLKKIFMKMGKCSTYTCYEQYPDRCKFNCKDPNDYNYDDINKFKDRKFLKDEPCNRGKSNNVYANPFKVEEKHYNLKEQKFMDNRVRGNMNKNNETLLKQKAQKYVSLDGDKARQNEAEEKAKCGTLNGSVRNEQQEAQDSGRNYTNILTKDTMDEKTDKQSEKSEVYSFTKLIYGAPANNAKKNKVKLKFWKKKDKQ